MKYLKKKTYLHHEMATCYYLNPATYASFLSAGHTYLDRLWRPPYSGPLALYVHTMLHPCVVSAIKRANTSATEKHTYL